MYTPSILTKFRLFENSQAGVPGSSNLRTRLNMVVVCRQTWTFFYDTYLNIFRTNFFKNSSCSLYVLYTHQVSCLRSLPSWGTQELELGYSTANGEHEPIVVYETFLKIHQTNFFQKIPASCSLYALYTHQVWSLWKLPSRSTRELELEYTSQYARF